MSYLVPYVASSTRSPCFFPDPGEPREGVLRAGDGVLVVRELAELLREAVLREPRVHRVHRYHGHGERSRSQLLIEKTVTH